MPLFRWEEIDHRLVILKLTDLAEEMHGQIKADERRIRFENRGNLNINALPSLVLKMKQDRADEWARSARRRCLRMALELVEELWSLHGI